MMKENYKTELFQIRISRIIAKSIKKEANLEEQEELYDWLNKSKENIQFYEKVSSQTFIDNKKKQRDSIDWEEDCYKFISMMSKRRRRIRRLSIIKYASIFIILLVSSIYLNYVNNNKNTHHISSRIKIIQNEPKVILTLSEGQQIDLTNKIDTIREFEKGASISIGDKELVYNKNMFELNTIRQDVVYNTLQLPNSETYQLILSDGTKVWINANSKLKYPASFNNNERKVYLEGEAYFDVYEDKKRPFIVDLGYASVKVLGTEFNVRAYDDEKEISAVLVNGSVQLYSTKHKKDILLKPGERSSLTYAGVLKTENVNTYNYTAWKDGRFVFENKSIEEILEHISSWYDVNILYLDENCKKIRFSGDLEKKISLQKILQIMESSERVEFHIENNTVSVRSKNNYR